MFATRLVAACSVAGTLLAGPAFGQSPKPSEELPAPRPVTEPKQVVVRAVCYEMPADLIERISRAVDGKAAGGRAIEGFRWTLTPREAGLLEALLRAEKAAGGVDVLSRPQLILTDGQTGFLQVGQQIPVAAGVQQVVYIAHSGIVLRTTPRVVADGRVSMRNEMHYSAPNPQPVVLADGSTTTAIDSQSVQTTDEVPDGHTILVGSLVRTKSKNDPRPVHIVWQFTPVVVRNEAERAAAMHRVGSGPVPAPVPVGPPQAEGGVRPTPLDPTNLPPGVVMPAPRLEK